MKRAIQTTRPEITIGILLRLAFIGFIAFCLSSCITASTAARKPRNKGAEIEREHPTRPNRITKQARRAIRWAANRK